MQVLQYGDQNQKATGWPTYPDPKSALVTLVTGDDSVEVTSVGDADVDVEPSGPHAPSRPMPSIATRTQVDRRGNLTASTVPLFAVVSPVVPGEWQ